MHVDILTEKQKSILEILSEIDIVGDFYLAGGTALGLQYGHRQSIDFDFFKEEPFLVDDVLSELKQKGKLEIRKKLENTLLILFDGISCSFFKYPYPLLNKTIEFKKHIQLASIPDLASMKISAISTRGTKRDFVDLYFICKNKYSLAEVLNFFQYRFKVFDHDLYHVYKSLIYFDDAEQDVMPEIYEKTNWNEIKAFFKKQINELMQ